MAKRTGTDYSRFTAIGRIEWADGGTSDLSATFSDPDQVVNWIGLEIGYAKRAAAPEIYIHVTNNHNGQMMEFEQRF